MESFAFELSIADNDALDRVICLRWMSEGLCLCQRAIRLRRDVRIGQALLELDRLVIGWCHPGMEYDSHVEELVDSFENALGEPF